jgi:hypothetical protein
MSALIAKIKLDFNAAVSRISALESPNYNPTFGTVTANGYVDGVGTLTGTSPAFSLANGGIQMWTLSGASTPTDSLSDGEAILLGIDDGSSNTITWPAGTWINNAGAEPTLAATGYTWVVAFKSGSALYFQLSGDGT